MKRNTYLVAGGAGFIGSNFILNSLIHEEGCTVINIDKLTYAGNLENLQSIKDDPRHIFIHGDICNIALVEELFETYNPSIIVNFAAETHVDRSIHEPLPFVKTNVSGMCNLMQVALEHWNKLPGKSKDTYRFINISTDEVYGSLDSGEAPLCEGSVYRPNSPYAASKAAADQFARAYYQTYQMPTITIHASNNFGPHQFPEKLIPLTIYNALHGKNIPIYGDGNQSRNWIYVTDCCEAIHAVIDKGKIGESYNIGDTNEITNIALVKKICEHLDTLCQHSDHRPHGDLITHVNDRPGHDRRYALNTEKLNHKIGWKPKGSFDDKLLKTIQWYLDNEKWLEHVISGEYHDWIEKQYRDEV
ncbi:MAG: dTDP-glucose 4,6-dehydratase [Chlamydiota bacterium]|nr:dTDP-glucose 4,6-dehydratase [Chlamydiota bacterium]